MYEAVKEIQSANILILQGRENFVSSVSHKTVAKMIKAKLYGKLGLKEWYPELLTETYYIQEPLKKELAPKTPTPPGDFVKQGH